MIGRPKAGVGKRLVVPFISYYPTGYSSKITIKGKYKVNPFVQIGKFIPQIGILTAREAVIPFPDNPAIPSVYKTCASHGSVGGRALYVIEISSYHYF